MIEDDEPGICPQCGRANLEWEASYPEDNMYCYEFTCQDCGAEGKEWYELMYEKTIVTNTGGENMPEKDDEPEEEEEE